MKFSIIVRVTTLQPLFREPDTGGREASFCREARAPSLKRAVASKNNIEVTRREKERYTYFVVTGSKQTCREFLAVLGRGKTHCGGGEWWWKEALQCTGYLCAQAVMVAKRVSTRVTRPRAVGDYMCWLGTWEFGGGRVAQDRLAFFH
jgi:hypothetical protein